MIDQTFGNKLGVLRKSFFKAVQELDYHILIKHTKDGRNHHSVVSWEDRPHVRRSIELSLLLLSTLFLGQSNHADFFIFFIFYFINM